MMPALLTAVLLALAFVFTQPLIVMMMMHAQLTPAMTTTYSYVDCDDYNAFTVDTCDTVLVLGCQYTLTYCPQDAIFSLSRIYLVQ